MRRMSIACGLLAVATPLAGTLLAGAGESPVTLEKGTEVRLELLHHLTSKHTPAGSDVFLEVVEAVVANGRVVIPPGSVVRGVVQDAALSKSAGRAGSISFSVDSIVAVDGAEVPVSGDFASYGRDRAKAAGRFGLMGLLAKGRMAYVEKGSRFTATVSDSREIGPASWTSADRVLGEATLASPAGMEDDSVTLAIEKGRSLSPIEVLIATPRDRSLTDDEVRRVSLVRVNDLVLPEPVRPIEVDGAKWDRDRDGLAEHELTFDGWQILRYCDNGPSELVFRGELGDGSVLEATASLNVAIKKK